DRLYYITGGVGFLEGEFRDGGGHANTVTPAGLADFTAPASKDVFAFGGGVGGGIEWGVAPNLSVKAEGLYLAFDENLDLSDLSGVGAPGDHLKIGDTFAFRLGGNWRPGHPAGAIAASTTEHDVAAPYKWGGLYLGPQFGWGGLVT